MGKTKMKRFLTIFPAGTNIHLIKDVGMIPFFLNRAGYYESYISFYEDKSNLEYLSTDVKDLKYIQLKRYFRNENLNIFIFILFNLRRFDVIMFFHQDFFKTVFALFVKMITFNGIKFYFKLDANDSIKDSKFAKSTGLLKKIKIYFYNKIDLISVETRHLQDYFNYKLRMKVAYIPNGFDFSQEIDQIRITNGNKRENIFTLVGRIGAPEKDHLILLKALKQIDLKDWRIEILGPIEEDFKNEIMYFFESTPHLRDKVVFRGAISDRRQLFGILSKSKIFIQTSKFESFGLALLEAMSCGCFIVSTDLTPSKEIAGANGVFFNIGDDHKLANILQSIIDEVLILPQDIDIIKYSKQEYNWTLIVEKINFYLNK